MLRIIYTLLLIIVAPLYLYPLLKKTKGKPTIGHRWKEYFGITSPCISNHKPIWIHAVSVGETIAATPIIKKLKEEHPNRIILLTTTTSTGAQQAEKIIALVEHRYMPLDFPFAIKWFLRSIKPECLLIMETELWPNTLHIVAKANIPITVINARLSERSFLRYKRIPPLFQLFAKNLSQVLCQHQDDADRFIKLGLEEQKVKLTGSVKFDIQVNEQTLKKGKDIRALIGKDRPVWIAASTHQGEDEQVFDAHQILLTSFPDALLITVPRHPERFQSVLSLSSSLGFKTVTRTSQLEITPETDVYLADTMGEMLLLLQASDICFMGGSLIGDKVGGHNLLEPAALGKALIIGPSYFNFFDITNQLSNANAVIFCSDSTDLSTKLIELFSDEDRRRSMGNNATNVVNNNRGAIDKTITYIGSHLSSHLSHESKSAPYS